jgi:hypothetical protein
MARPPAPFQPTRSFDRDWQTMMDLGQPSQTGTPTAAGTASNSAPADPNPVRDGGAVYRAPGTPVPSGPLAQRIYRSAVARLGTPNTLYWKDRNLACASFVSTVLTDVGLNSGPGDGRLFTRFARDLTRTTELMGARPVFPGHSIRLTPENLAQIQDGDIVQLQERGENHFSHSGVGEHGSQLVYASSSGFEIRRAVIFERWSGFDQFQIHRFTR